MMFEGFKSFWGTLRLPNRRSLEVEREMTSIAVRQARDGVSAVERAMVAKLGMPHNPQQQRLYGRHGK